MLTKLRSSAPVRTGRDVVDLLLECHARIRRFLGMARHLADAEAVADREASEAAAAIGRYFEVALPLHTTDEDDRTSTRTKRSTRSE